MLSTYRVNYYLGTAPKVAYVVASSEGEASAHMGVRDGSAQVSTVASPVEVVGMTVPHAPIAPIPVNKAPYDMPKSVGRAEFEALEKQLAELRAELANKRA